MKRNERFKLQESLAEHQYFEQKLDETIDDLLPQLSNDQLDRLEFACGVEYRERHMKTNPNQIPF